MAAGVKASIQPKVAAPETRQALYSQLEAVSWDDDGSHVLDYLRRTSLPEKQPSDPTLILFLLECSERKGCSDIADAIIDHALSINASLVDEVGGDDGDTPLHSAVAKKNAVLSQILLQHSAKLNPKSRIGRTALHAAAAAGDSATVQVLSNHAHSLDSARDGVFLTPLAFAYTSRNAEAAQHLSTTWANLILAKDYNGCTPLHVSAMHGHVDVAVALLGTADTSGQQSQSPAAARRAALEAAKSTMEWRTREGYTALWLVCSAGHIEMVNSLLLHGADPGATSDGGETCLWAAVKSRRLDVARRLLKETAVLEQIHDTSGGGQNVLSLACRDADTDMINLLLSAGAHCSSTVYTTSSPLAEAIACANNSTLKLLLKSESFRANAGRALFLANEDGEKTTIFHVALRCDNIKGIKKLLEHGVEPTCRDDKGRTVLHEACLLGNYPAAKLLLEDSRMRQESLIDQDGRTALHLASFGGADGHVDLGLANGEMAPNPGSASSEPCTAYERIMEVLIKKGANYHLQDHRGDSMLHLALKQGHSQRAALLLGIMDAEDDYFSLSEPNDEMKTPLICALETGNRATAERIAQKMHTVRFPDSRTRDHLLMWLLTAEKADHLVVSLLFKESCARARIPSSDVPGAGAGVLEWAAFAGSVPLVWHALWALSLANGPKRWEVLDAASEFAARECERYTSRSFEGNVDDAPRAGHDTDAMSATEMMTDSREIYNDILRLLANPPGTTCVGAQKTSSWSPSNPSDQSPVDPSDQSPSDPADGTRNPPTDKYMAQLLEVYVDTIDPDERSIADTIYSKGPLSILSKNLHRGQPLDAQSDCAGHGQTRPCVDIKPNFRWVHLPANNMQWMADVSGRLHSELGLDFKNFIWLRNSWSEIEHQDSQMNFMKPRGISLKSVGPQPACAAIYVPYAAPAWHSEDAKLLSPDYDGLCDYYALFDYPIHGTRSLNEYFNLSRLTSGDSNSVSEGITENFVAKRNHDQVLGRVLRANNPNKQSWVLVNIDQLWIWVLDQNTIVSAATHRRDFERDPVFTATRHALESSIRASKRVPQDAFEMAHYLTETCGGFFRRTFSMEESFPPPRQPSLDSNPLYAQINLFLAKMRRKPVCIKDAFSVTILNAIAKSDSLYENFIDREQKPATTSISRKEQNEAATKDRVSAAKLLRDIKHVRDELRMLMVIAQHQRTVQSDFRDAVFGRPCGYHLDGAGELHDLDEMMELDSEAERIESAINTTLNLEQNAAAITQANAAVEQGQVILLFTVVTILFLPLSFFTSLFAMQVDTFLKTPRWAYITMFMSSTLISGLLTFYAFYSDTVKRFFVDPRGEANDFWRRMFPTERDGAPHAAGLRGSSDKDSAPVSMV